MISYAPIILEQKFPRAAEWFTEEQLLQVSPYYWDMDECRVKSFSSRKNESIDDFDGFEDLNDIDVVYDNKIDIDIQIDLEAEPDETPTADTTKSVKSFGQFLPHRDESDNELMEDKQEEEPTNTEMEESEEEDIYDAPTLTKPNDIKLKALRRQGKRE